MRTALAVLLFMLATPSLAGEPLGPAGIPQTEPFALNADYMADYRSAELCPEHPTDVDAVKMGKRAVYVIDGASVEVFLDEYARRFALDYCWL